MHRDTDVGKSDTLPRSGLDSPPHPTAFVICFLRGLAVQQLQLPSAGLSRAFPQTKEALESLPLNGCQEKDSPAWLGQFTPQPQVKGCQGTSYMTIYHLTAKFYRLQA